MRVHWIRLTGLIFGIALMSIATLARAQEKAAAASADEKAIRATADEFVKAFNAGDAKTIGAEWSTDADYTDESGEDFHGRAAIEALYAQMFKEHPGGTVTVKIDSVRFFGPDVAVEKGIASVKSPKGESSAARYTVVHARRDGKWIMVDCKDSPYVSAADGDVLKDLEWLIGEWKIDSPDKERRTPDQIRMGRGPKLHQEQFQRHQGRQGDAHRRPDHRLASQACTDRLDALRRQRRLRQRHLDQRRLEMGDRRVRQCFATAAKPRP